MTPIRFALMFTLLAGSSASALNPIQIENALPGDSSWTLTNPATDREIEGYASATSVNVGETIRFFVNANSPPAGPQQAYTLTLYRMGYYGGTGGRQVAPQELRLAPYQPMPDLRPGTDPARERYLRYGLIECNWTDPYPPFQIPLTWVSGFYLAKLERQLDGKQSYIVFVVRDDARHSDFLFQSSVTTYQAYNNWPGPEQPPNSHPPCYSPEVFTEFGPKTAKFAGKSLYDWNSSAYYGSHPPDECHPRAAVKVSFNRPYAIRADPYPLVGTRGVEYEAANGVGAGEFLTTLNGPCYTRARGSEYSYVRYLESIGFDVTYATNIDVHTGAANLLNRRAFLSVGHDEYWSKGMRFHVEEALAAGVNLGFFSANTAFYHIRLEDGNRTIVSYKYDHGVLRTDLRGDPDPADVGDKAGLFRDTLSVFGPLGEDLHEARLIGIAYSNGSPVYPEPYFRTSYTIDDPGHWVVRDSGVSHLDDIVGYEVDEKIAPFSPLNVDVIGHAVLQPAPASPDPAARCHHVPITDQDPGQVCIEFGGTLTTCRKAQIVSRKAPSGAIVFSGGSIQWSWGTDDYDASSVDGSPYPGFPLPPVASDGARKVNQNVLERFRSYDRSDLFDRGGDSAFHRRSLASGVWLDGTTPAGGVFLSGPAVASTGIDRLSVFGVGGDGRMWTGSWNGATWSGWTPLPGVLGVGGFVGDPAATSWSEQRLDLFARRADGRTWHAVSSNGAWSAWSAIEASAVDIQGGVAAASWGTGNLSIFGVDSQHRLRTLYWTGSNWSGWNVINPEVTDVVSEPAAVSWGSQRLDVVARRGDNAIWHVAYSNGAWSSWATLGGSFNSAPAITSWAERRLQVSAVDSSGRVMAKSWNGSVWSDWTEVAGLGAAVSSPDAVSWYGQR